LTIIRTLICNKCGKNSKDSNGIFVANEYHEISITFAYGSDLDGLKYTFHMCDACAKKLIDSLEILAQVGEVGLWE